MTKGYLVLENGQVFEGVRQGALDDVTGEVVFTTGMTGYLETLTDPSYYGQIVVQTFPLIGNYGVIPEDFESERPRLSGYVVRDLCAVPSNFRSEGALSGCLKEMGVPVLTGVDTREITRAIREAGVMNGRIMGEGDFRAHRRAIAAYRVERAIESVTAKQPFTEAPERPILTVVLWDFGAKANIRRELIRRGCRVITVPAHTSAIEILAQHPDGVMLTNGPGDPADNPGIIRELKRLTRSKVPIFGICMGHQLLALSQGAKTEKLKYGHRGANQPAKNTSTGRVYITSQNHGYAVVPDSIPENAYMSYVNANDGTCEGIDYEDMPAFSVQFHPEASAGPMDTSFLFDRFIDLMGGK
ncbi:carbamoyl phosphate synthase small subunit [Gehongia tenuis]|uniref:Carbamoyl phosphate synthase small chain n=1 Tax=Gehongia tenuis TaxID=2763655 RepID=A0A926D355_9FIRM|nr:carbamoyl phosphate synthase small subunit [Gehongia tenuis]MBC8530487.1 glutamine-hydrolyzing carbamoyl-phosphate synthase small subunit [Gehongia tenuis]